MSTQLFSRLLTETGVRFATRAEDSWRALDQAPWDNAKGELGPAISGSYGVPVAPSKIIGVGKNYRAHAAEMGGPVPSEPLLFLKAPSSLSATGQEVELPSLSERVDYEGELGVIIGRTARRVSVDSAMDYVFGYCVACDITARDLQNKDGQWARAKSFDGFCPLGPVISTGVDVSRARLQTLVNGQVKQSALISDMVFNLSQIVSHISQAITLFPGDLILTGTPDGVGPLHPGDQVRVQIDGLEALEFAVAR